MSVDYAARSWRPAGEFRRSARAAPHAAHAGGFPRPMRCERIILRGATCDVALDRTEQCCGVCLSTLSSRGSTPCTPLSFLWMTLHPRPEFQPTPFSIDQNELR